MARTSPPVEDSASAPRKEKSDFEPLENRDWNLADEDEDLDRHPGFWGRFLKKNPSPTFLSDVAMMNATDLEPPEVKRIERKVDLLIIPALSVCYMVSYSPTIQIINLQPPVYSSTMCKLQS